MSAYWSADNSVSVGEKKISVPSENGLSYSPGQKVQIFVDPSTKFMDGRETYLQFNVKLALPSGAGTVPTRLQLDKCTSTIIKNIRIYDGSRGSLLEEISDYATYVAVKYDYDKDKSTENMRALTEGCAVHSLDNAGTKGTTKTGMANTTTNPFFKKEITEDTTTAFTDANFLNAKLCLPLHTGIFADSSTIFPVMLTNGLYIEIDLNSAEAICKQLDSVLRDTRTPLNPVFHSLNGSSTPDTLLNGSDLDRTFYVKRDNNNVTLDKFPFVVGETFNFCRSINNGSGATMSDTMEISQLNLSSTADGANGLIQVTIKTARTNNTGSAIDQNWVMYSTAVEGKTSYDCSYEVSNVNLVVSQVVLDPGYEAGMIRKVQEGKAIEFDIMSATNYKHSILATDRQTTFQIFAQNSRAKSLLVVPQDSTVYNSADLISGNGTYEIVGTGNDDDDATTKQTDQDVSITNTRSAYTGICDQLSSVQYQVNGKRVPSREISTKKIATKNSLDAFHLYELEKTLDNSGIKPKSFSEFMNNFVFGRSFSAGGQNGVLDLRGKDLAVILKYQETKAPEKGKLFNSYVFHIRRLVIRDGTVDVML